MSMVYKQDSKKIEPLLLAALLLLVICSRFIFLKADPPAWLESNYLMDEGLWADGARGKVFFNDYFADDVGSPYLVTPGYTWLLQGIYSLAGVGLVQTRFLAALTNILSIVLMAVLAYRRVSLRAAILVVLILGLSPFYWAHGRVALQESTLVFFIVLSLVLWFLNDQSRFMAALAGVAMGVAFVIKPNTIMLGAIPLMGSAILSYFLYCRQKGKMCDNGFAGRAFLASLGFLAVIGLLFVVHIQPNWTRYWPVFFAEGGSGSTSLKEQIFNYGLSWTQIDLASGGANRILWRQIYLSPALFAGGVLYVLDCFLRTKRTSRPRDNQGIPTWELGIMAWFFIGWALLESNTYKPERRYVILIPALSIMTVIYLVRLWNKQSDSPDEIIKGRYNCLLSFLLWAALLFPVLVLMEPGLMRLAVLVYNNLGKPGGFAVEMPSAGLLCLAGWFILLIILAFFPEPANKAARILTRRVGPVLIPLLLLGECIAMGRYYLVAQNTLPEVQMELRKYVDDGEIVLGSGASTLFMPYKIRTVRRILPGSYSNPPPNPDVWDRLQPRYIIQMTRYEFLPNPPRYQDLIDKGYEKIHHFEVGAYRKGESRAAWDLYRRIPVDASP